MTDEELSHYLPKFLPDGEIADLYSDLKQFTDARFNGSKGMDYSNYYGEFSQTVPHLNQGDGINEMPIFKLPNPKSKLGKGFIISNTCDVFSGNNRRLDVNFLYATIIRMDAYEELLKKSGTYSKNRIDAIKAQQVSDMFYLPAGAGLKESSIVLFDTINSIDSSVIPDGEIENKRIFQLSQSAWYILLIKLTYHFVRVNEGLLRDRSPSLA